MKRTQRGMTMLGFLITLSVVILFLFVGMKIVPMYIEYYSVKKMLGTIAANPASASPGPWASISTKWVPS